MVLLVLSLFGILVVNASKLNSYFEENVLLILYFDPDESEESIQASLQDILAKPYVKRASYVSSEDAAKKYVKVVEKDFVEILNDNPLPPSIEVFLKSEAIRNQIEITLAELRSVSGVQEVDYQRDLLQQIDRYKNVLGMVLIGMSILLIGISLVLINSSIRLTIYSNRFLIKSMQLVGATEAFIIKPFLRSAVVSTLIAGTLAFAGAMLLFGMIGSFVQSAVFDNAVIIFNWDTISAQIPVYSILFALVLIIGFALVLPSTFWATKKYLRLKIDDLY